ncbi:hypothetical protein T484DRAFT_1886431, partial [Baffinella frigidus]
MTRYSSVGSEQAAVRNISHQSPNNALIGPGAVRNISHQSPDNAAAVAAAGGIDALANAVRNISHQSPDNAAAVGAAGGIDALASLSLSLSHPGTAEQGGAGPTKSSLVSTAPQCDTRRTRPSSRPRRIRHPAASTGKSWPRPTQRRAHPNTSGTAAHGPRSTSAAARHSRMAPTRARRGRTSAMAARRCRSSVRAGSPPARRRRGGQAWQAGGLCPPTAGRIARGGDGWTTG